MIPIKFLDHENLFRAKAKRTDNGEWVEGFCFLFKGKPYITVIKQTYMTTYYEEKSIVEFNMRAYEVSPYSVFKCTGKKYMNLETVYEGDIFESQVSGDLMAVRYGTYQSYCPVDREYMDSIGFFAECKGYPSMPLGDLHDYALKKGNIIDTPELIYL